MSADDALVDLARRLFTDARMTAQPGWRRMFLIGRAEPGHVSLEGFTFDAENAGRPTSPSSESGVADALVALQEAMQAENPTGRAWISCLVRISSEGSIALDVEYDDASRWAPKGRQYREHMASFADMPV